MDALFIIPAMVSPNVPDTLVPALAKFVERNIVLTNASKFRAAVLKKYSTIPSQYESTDIFSSILEASPKPDARRIAEEEAEREASREAKEDARDEKRKQERKQEIADKEEADERKRKEVKPQFGGAVPKGKVPDSKFADVDKVEIPNGIAFFTSISLEPTYLSIPIEQAVYDNKYTPGSESPVSERIVLIGVKSVPYKISGVTSLVNMMSSSRKNILGTNMSIIRRLLLRNMRRLIAQIPFTTANRIYKKGERNYDPRKNIIYSPSFDVITNTKKLAKAMSGKSPATWSTMLILSVDDFEEDDLRANLLFYNRLMAGGFGEIVIVDPSKETAHFCMQRMQSCYELSFSSMKKLLSLDDVLDYSEVSKWTRGPFGHVSSIKSVLRASATPLTDSELLSEEVHSKILDMITRD